MSLAIDPTAKPAEELERTLISLLDEALESTERLRRGSGDPSTTIHRIRKRGKELRALGRLAAPALGHEFTTFDSDVRDAAKQLAAARDGHALSQTVGVLGQGMRSPGAGGELRRSLTETADRETELLLGHGSSLDTVRDLLLSARSEVSAWRLPTGIRPYTKGLAATYRRARKGLRSAHKSGSDDAFHVLRRHSKRLWYQLRFLQPVSPSALGPMVEALDRLADSLGDDHDLAVLVGRLDGGHADRDLREAIGEHRAELQAASLRAATSLLTEKPDVFANRVRSYWKASRKFGPEVPVHGLVDLTEPEAREPSTVERERKWLLPAPPKPLPPGTPMRQGYVSLAEGTTVRVRDAGSQGATLTVKAGSGRLRTEVELDLAEDQFDALWPLTETRRIEKVRHRVTEGHHVVEVDVFHGELSGLVYAEVEFDSDAELEAFRAPGWFGREVTDDPRYTNASLAAHGIPAGALDSGLPTTAGAHG